MMRTNRASLSVYSDAKSAAEISRLLSGLEPRRWADKGDLTPAGKTGRDIAPERLRYQRSWWSSVIVEIEDSEEDQTGFAALRVLVERLMPLASVLADLRHDGETIIWWSGDSDSSQGGFILDAGLISQLAVLGCDVFGTAYLEEDEDEDANRDRFGAGNQQAWST